MKRKTWTVGRDPLFLSGMKWLLTEAWAINRKYADFHFSTLSTVLLFISPRYIVWILASVTVILAFYSILEDGNLKEENEKVFMVFKDFQQATFLIHLSNAWGLCEWSMVLRVGGGGDRFKVLLRCTKVSTPKVLSSTFLRSKRLRRQLYTSMGLYFYEL